MIRVTAGVERLNDRPESPVILSLITTALQPAQIASHEIELAFQANELPRFIDRHLRMRPLQRDLSLNDYSPLLVRWAAGPDLQYELRNALGFTACRLAWRAGWLRVRVAIDAAALHPRWRVDVGRQSAAAPEWRVGDSLCVALLLSELRRGDEHPVVTLGRYPGGSEAALALTDHCDFDSSDRLRLFLHGDDAGAGWLGRGLRMTKSVFALTSDTGSRSIAATLQDEPYRKLIEVLAADGSEIAPHSLNQWGRLDPHVFHQTLTSLAARWATRTWIDHGYLAYNYVMGGACDARFRLTDRLRQEGFVTLAAGHDIPVDARVSLNMLAPPRVDGRPVATTAWTHVRTRRPRVALRYLRSALHRRLVGPAGYLLDGVLLSLSGTLKTLTAGERRRLPTVAEHWGIAWRRLKVMLQIGTAKFRVPYARRELLDVAAVVYPERGVPLSQARPDDLMLFTAHEAVHTQDIYTHEALERLLHERGLHIGHTYLLNELPYIAGVFACDSPTPRLSAAWRAFLDALGAATRDERLWNPTMSELAEYMRAMQHVGVHLDQGGVLHVSSRLPTTLRDVTLLVPRESDPAAITWNGKPPKGWREWKDWLAVWGDVPPEGAVISTRSTHSTSKPIAATASHACQA